MIILAWVLVGLMALLVVGFLAWWAIDDPDDFVGFIFTIGVMAIVAGGIWGLGYINHWWPYLH